MEDIRKFLDEIFEESYLRQTFKLSFGAKRKKQSELDKVSMRPMLLRDNLKVQVERIIENKALHENLDAQEAKSLALELLTSDFKQLNIISQKEEVQVLASKIEKPHITKNSKKIEKKEPTLLAHNRSKEYIIPEGKPVEFMVKLGVMNKNGEVLHKSYPKFRQINRYLEIVDDIFKKGKFFENKIKVVDFGCGKAYLTFALYYYLNCVKGYDVDIVGIDLKKSVIEFCKKLAYELDYQNLRFEVGDIRSYEESGVDMVISLHACDTATDYALNNAVKWGAKAILSVPCCQHELFSQIENELHFPIYRHGILKDKFTEILTNGLRGLMLEACGYKVDMIEFTSLEHTAKNVMIRAFLDETATKCEHAQALSAYDALKKFYNVSPSTDILLGEVKDV